MEERQYQRAALVQENVQGGSADGKPRRIQQPQHFGFS